MAKYATIEQSSHVITDYEFSAFKFPDSSVFDFSPIIQWLSVMTDAFKTYKLIINLVYFTLSDCFLFFS